MEINIGSLTITNFCRNNRAHYELKRELLRDGKLDKLGFRHLDTQLVESPDINSLKENASYVIEENKIPIGYTRLGELNWAGTLKMEGIILEEYRGNNYGYRMLTETTKYILENVDGVKEIRLDVDINNYPSIKLVERSGYTLKERKGNNYDYRYGDREDEKSNRRM